MDRKIPAPRVESGQPDHQIRDGDVVQFEGFGALDAKQYRIERSSKASDESDSITLTLTEVRPL